MIYPKTNINKMGIATKYHGKSIVLPNQLTVQDERDNVTANITKSKNAFFILPPPSEISIA